MAGVVFDPVVVVADAVGAVVVIGVAVEKYVDEIIVNAVVVLWWLLLFLVMWWWWLWLLLLCMVVVVVVVDVFVEVVNLWFCDVVVAG